MAFQIDSIVYSIVVQADNMYRKHQAPCYWPFVRGNPQWLLDSKNKVPAMWKVCPCHDVIMKCWLYLLQPVDKVITFPHVISRAANQYGISVFCTDFTCKIREYEFGLENTEIELCQFCHLKYCCQNKAYLFWVANQSGFVAFYALEPSNTSLITKTFKLLSSTCSSNRRCLFGGTPEEHLI